MVTTRAGGYEGRAGASRWMPWRVSGASGARSGGDDESGERRSHRARSKARRAGEFRNFNDALHTEWDEYVR